MVARLFAILASVVAAVASVLVMGALALPVKDALIVAVVFGVMCGKWIGGPRYSAPPLLGSSDDDGDSSNERYGKWKRLFYG